jgi:hypothetical protein
MKEYNANIHIPYHVQEALTFSGVEELGVVFSQYIRDLGADLLTQVYQDSPEFFSQENLPNQLMTKYKVKLFIIGEREYLEIQKILRIQYPKWEADHGLDKIY